MRGDDVVARLLAAVGDHHRRALGGEPLGRGAADARAAARHERDASLEPFHGRNPISSA